jgi:hypothetical protein
MRGCRELDGGRAERLLNRAAAGEMLIIHGDEPMLRRPAANSDGVRLRKLHRQRPDVMPL